MTGPFRVSRFLCREIVKRFSDERATACSTQLFSPAPPTSQTRIYPTSSVHQLVSLCSSKEEYVANILFRAVEEQSKKKLGNFQNELFLSIQSSLASDDFRIYRLFACFSRGIIRSSSPSIRDRQVHFLASLVTQPVLRLKFSRADLQLDANKVLEAMGAACFLRNREALHLDLLTLSDKSVGIIFDRIPSRGSFDLVRFAFDLLGARGTEEGGLGLRLGKDWTLRRLLEEVCGRKSTETLAFFVSRSAEISGLRQDLVEFVNERDEVTGLCLRGWAREALGGDQLQSVWQPREIMQPKTVAEPTISQGGDEVYYVDSSSKLVAMFRRVEKMPRLAVNWFPGLFVVVSDEQSFVIDVLAVKTTRDFGLFTTLNFVLDQLFVNQEQQKLVFCAESLMEAIGSFRGAEGFEDFADANAEISIENLVDVRRPWIRRSLVPRPARTAVDKERALAAAMLRTGTSLNQMAPEFEEGSLMEQLDFFAGYLPLKAMCERFLDVQYASVRRTDMERRPLSMEQLLGVVEETSTVLKLAHELNRRGFVPQQSHL